MRKLYITTLISLLFTALNAQNNVGIGTTAPSPNALLHLENGAADLGLLLPNVTTSGFTPLASDEGLMVYDPGLNQIFSWDGSAWQPAGGTISLQSAYDGGQLVNMGSGNIDFQSSAANPVLYLDEANERVGIGTNAPGAQFEVSQEIVVNGIKIGRGLNNDNRSTGLGIRTLDITNLGAANTAIGYEAGWQLTNGTDNVALGSQSLTLNTTGSRNTALGGFALFNNLTGSDNTAIGALSDVAVDGLTNATVIGANATVGASNSLVLGNNANVGIGTSTPANKLEVIGDAAKFDSIIVVNNAQAGYVLTAAGASGAASWQPAGAGSSWNLLGNAGTIDGTNFIGTTDNVPLNFRVNNTPAGRIDHIQFNTSFGRSTLQSISAGTHNTAVGNNAMIVNSTGSRNAAFGSQALQNGNSDDNVAIGFRSLMASSGGRNTALGYQTGNTITTGNSNTFIGYDADATSNNLNNATAIGANASVAIDNALVLGNNANVGIGNSSPHAPLQFATALANRKIVLFEGADNDHQYFGFGVNAAALRYQVNGTFASHIFYASVNTTTSNELMRIVGDGNVGIGVSAPTERLQISSSAVSTSMIITNDAIGLTNTDGLLIGENNAGVGIINNRENERLLIGTNGNIGQMLLDQSGNVGIGQATPLHRLDVLGAIRSGGNGLDGQMRIFSEQGATDYEVIFNPNPAMTATTTYTLPADDGAASEVLTTDGAGGLSWGSASGITADNALTLTGVDLDLGGAMSQNTILDRNDYAFVLGTNNTITGPQNAELIFGYDNTISGFGGIAIGTGNTVGGNRGTALGNYVEANHLGSFLIGDWSGSGPELTASSTTDQFTARFNSGYRFYATSNPISNPNTGMFINNAGFVGIGTNNPGNNQLSVVTQSTNGSAGYFENNIASGIDGSALRVLNSGTRSIGHNGALIQNLVTKVGGSNSTKRGLKIESTGAWGVATVNQPNIGLDVTVSGADNNYAAIFNGGNVGIGTSAPNDRLDVNGSIRINDNDLYFRPGNDTNHGLGWYYSGKQFGTFQPDGPVLYGNLGGGLGRTQLGTNTIQLAWDGSGVTVFGVFNNLSDERVKDNISEIDYGLEEIMELKPIKYNWKEGHGEGVSLGFIAQEVLKVAPEIVNIPQDSSELYSMSYIELIPILVKSIQEQQDLINQQKNEIEDLQSHNSKVDISDQVLEDKLNTMQSQIDRLNNLLTAQVKK